MILYASQTNTRRNLAIMRSYGWRLMIAATGQWNTHHFPYALDNGAWHCFQHGKGWDPMLFQLLLLRLGDGADFVVVPDIVAGGLESLAFSAEWLTRLDGLACRKLIAVQDGMREDDVAPLLGDDVGIFVGGSTEWKESTIPAWGALRRATACYMHVGRVNTARRIRKCLAAGVDSIDGSSASRYAFTVPHLTRAAKTRKVQTEFAF